jgi:hypothetical protein
VNDERTNDEAQAAAVGPEAERRAADAALAALAAPAAPAADGEAPDPLARLYAELLGLVAYELDERPPAPGVRARVLAAARGEAEHRARVTAFPRRVPAAADEPGARTPLPRWLLATAAALALAAVGLGIATGVLAGRVDDQRTDLVRLADELEASRRRAELLAVAQGALERRSLGLATQLALVANPGVEVCPLGPVGADPLHPQARGLLFLSMADHQWFVRVANLEPAPPGRVYRLWFLTADGGAMPGGALQPGPDAGISLGGRRLPDPTVMTGVAITLERQGEDPHRPTGETILFGDEKMTII